MVKMNQLKTVEVEAKSLSLNLKVSDMFDCALLDQDGMRIGYHSGYVPEFMPGKHYGDYVMLEIDIDTGQILNWKTPTAEQLEDTFARHEEQ